LEGIIAFLASSFAFLGDFVDGHVEVVASLGSSKYCWCGEPGVHDRLSLRVSTVRVEGSRIFTIGVAALWMASYECILFFRRTGSSAMSSQPIARIVKRVTICPRLSNGSIMPGASFDNLLSTVCTSFIIFGSPSTNVSKFW